MTIAARTPIGARTLLASAGVLTLVSIVLAYQVGQATAGRARFYETAVLNAAYWGLWAAMAPLVERVAHRFRFEAATWFRALLAHLTAATVLAFGHVMALSAVRRLLAHAAGRTPAAWWWLVRQSAAQTLDWNMMAYWMIVGAAFAVAYREEARVRALAALRLETELVQAQLRALQSQLHPHFLFNALNTVSALMHRDVALAERTLARLGDLLRVTLGHTGRQEVPLREELEFTRNYIDIERTRFQDRLSARLDVPPDTLDGLVPWMLLQPLVENAVKHGVAPQRRPSTIEIIARHEGNRLRLVVRDDGAGVRPDRAVEASAGTGLATTRARLRYQFGDDHEFAFVPRARGVEVRIAIPWRRDPAARDSSSTPAAQVYGT